MQIGIGPFKGFWHKREFYFTGVLCTNFLYCTVLTLRLPIIRQTLEKKLRHAFKYGSFICTVLSQNICPFL